MKRKLIFTLILASILFVGCGNADKIEELQVNLDAVTEQYNEVKADYDELQADNDTLQAEFDELQKKYDELSEKYLALEEEQNFTSDLKIYLPTGKFSDYGTEKRKFEILTEMAKDYEVNKWDGEGPLTIDLNEAEKTQKKLDEYYSLWE